MKLATFFDNFQTQFRPPPQSLELGSKVPFTSKRWHPWSEGEFDLSSIANTVSLRAGLNLAAEE